MPQIPISSCLVEKIPIDVKLAEGYINILHIIFTSSCNFLDYDFSHTTPKNFTRDGTVISVDSIAYSTDERAVAASTRLATKQQNRAGREPPRKTEKAVHPSDLS